jgi:hypothetical protein
MVRRNASEATPAPSRPASPAVDQEVDEVKSQYAVAYSFTY